MTKSDLVLVAYIVLIVPAMLVGFVFARRKMFEPYHKITMTTITLVNWALIILVMFVTYSRDVLPDVPQNLSLPGVLIPTIHLLPGLIAQLLATYLVIRMWFENQLPEWFKVKNIKIYMRTTLVLWLLTAVLGVVTWAVINKGLFAGAGPTVSVATAEAGTSVVRLISGNKFDPAELSIAAGTTVQFVNADTRAHTVTADDGSFDSGELKAGASFTFTFNQPGDVPYYCDFHGGKGHEGMSAIIHVTGTAVAGQATTAATVAPSATSAATTSVATSAATVAANAPAVVVVAMTDDAFQQKEITIPVGATIRWVNNGKHKHTATADDGSFASGQMKPGDTFEQRFDKAGDVPVYCENHGDKGGEGMSMIVHVTGSSAGVSTAAPTSAASGPAVVTVAMIDDEFQSKEITVSVGTTVHWVNNGKHKHTATADDGSFASGQMKPGDTFEQRFDKVGDVPVYCENHGDKGGQGMSMIVHVTAASSSPQVAAATSAATTAATTASVPTINPTVGAAAAPLITSADDTPNKVGYVTGAQSQMAIIKAEAAVIDSALKQGHIEDAQAAAEAILNTIQGGKGTDRDADGKINQPGDGYGLQPYIFSINENAATVQGVTTDTAQAAAADMGAMGRDALKALQTVTKQAQALIDAKTLVDARKVDLTSVSSLGDDISMIADDAAILGH